MEDSIFQSEDYFKEVFREEQKFINRRKNLIRDLFLPFQQRTNVKFLDIGCGRGHFLKLGDELNFETYGIDISEFAIDESKKCTKAKLYRTDIQKGTEFPNEFFDIITCLEVIEHLSRPVDVLKEIHRILKPNGILIITTPNANSLQRMLFPKNNSCLFDPTHILLFTPFTLSILVSRLGFKVEKCETHFLTLPPYLSKILKIFGLGGSIILIARKEGS